MAENGVGLIEICGNEAGRGELRSWRCPWRSS